MYAIKKIKKTCHPLTTTKSKKIDLQSDVCLWFIMDLLMQRKFYHVNVIGRSQRT